jgi:uncharacterized protein
MIADLVHGIGHALIPEERNAKVIETSVTLNYTTVLNIIFWALAAVLVIRFLRTGGPAMLRMMNQSTGKTGRPWTVRACANSR